MATITFSLFALATAIIGILFHYCEGRRRDFETALHKNVSAYFGNRNWSSPEIIAELKRYLTLNIDHIQKKKFAALIKDYYKILRDLTILKIILFINVVFIIAFALYTLTQAF